MYIYIHILFLGGVRGGGWVGIFTARYIELGGLYGGPLSMQTTFLEAEPLIYGPNSLMIVCEPNDSRHED